MDARDDEGEVGPGQDPASDDRPSQPGHDPAAPHTAPFPSHIPRWLAWVVLVALAASASVCVRVALGS